jgi:hypothetical protein
MSLNKCLEECIDEQTIEFFREKARKKIEDEKWVGRDAALKEKNFLQCWISERAWGKILDKRNIRNEWAGTYVGDAEHAPPNYKIWINKVETTLGIRSRTLKDLARWLEVPYPDDRFRLEREKIHDYIIISSVSFIDRKGAIVRFYGALHRDDLIKILQTIQRHLSPAQQEYFRPVPLKHFNYDLMLDLLSKADRN